MLASLKKKETYEHYLETLKFALYCITHPLDGFWDLTHEKRGSIAAANTILLLTLLANLFKLQYTSLAGGKSADPYSEYRFSSCSLVCGKLGIDNVV